MARKLTYAAREMRARKVAKREGFRLVKSKTRVTLNSGDRGGYRLLDADNVVAHGASFELSLDDVEKILVQR